MITAPQTKLGLEGDMHDIFTIYSNSPVGGCLFLAKTMCFHAECHGCWALGGHLGLIQAMVSSPSVHPRMDMFLGKVGRSKVVGGCKHVFTFLGIFGKAQNYAKNFWVMGYSMGNSMVNVYKAGKTTNQQKCHG